MDFKKAEAHHANLARLTGALLLVMTVAVMLGEISGSGAVDESIKTTTSIIPKLSRAGFASFLVAFLLDIPVAVFFYVLLKEVHATVSLLAMAFRLVYTAVAGACLIAYLAGLHMMNAKTYLLATLSAEQQTTLALFFEHVFKNGFSMALMFFSGHLVLLGWLLFCSRKIPRILSILVLVGGGSYFLDGILFFLAPTLQATVSPILMAFMMTEVLLALWLTIKGMKPSVVNATSPEV